MCLSSARNEDKSGGWIREKNRQKMYLGFNIQLGFKAKGNFSSLKQKTDIYSYARARSHTHRYKEEWAR
jgi:hypothetical protein